MFKVVVLGVNCDLVFNLDAVDLLRDLNYLGFALFKLGRDGRDDVGFFAEDKGGEEGDDFFGLIFGEDVFEDEFGKDEFASRVNLFLKKLISVRYSY